MAKSTIEVKGLRELGQAMKALEEDVKMRICRAAVQAGAKIIKDKAIAKAPVAPEPYEVVDQVYNKAVQRGKGVEGLKKKRKANTMIVQPRNIGRNIVTKRVPRSQMTAETVVAIRGKFKDGYANRIAILQEFGTVKQKPQPFMRPAFDEGKGPAVEAIKERLRRRIDKAVRQHGRKPK